MSREVRVDEEEAEELRTDPVAGDEVGEQTKSSVFYSSDLLEFLVRQVVDVGEQRVSSDEKTVEVKPFRSPETSNRTKRGQNWSLRVERKGENSLRQPCLRLFLQPSLLRMQSLLPPIYRPAD